MGIKKAQSCTPGMSEERQLADRQPWKSSPLAALMCSSQDRKEELTGLKRVLDSKGRLCLRLRNALSSYTTHRDSSPSSMSLNSQSRKTRCYRDRNDCTVCVIFNSDYKSIHPEPCEPHAVRLLLFKLWCESLVRIISSESEALVESEDMALIP